MNYQQTLDYLFSCLPAFHRIGKAAYKNNLSNSIALDEYFGSPHQYYRTVHIAGTNGKGSVSHLMASVLMEAGFKTGLYTSPHLKDFRERIKVNGKMIPEDEVTEFVRKHRVIIDTLEPSFFELTAAMAFDYFHRTGVDIAVIETGLGGRLDSTNIITPVISVITNIGHDHMDLLGDTIEKVAFEKAGIFKKNIPVVVGETRSETTNIFTEKAKESGSEIYFADQKYFCNLEDNNEISDTKRYLIKVSSEKREISGIIPLGGDYQAKNLQTLYQVCDCMKNTLNIGERAVIEGVKKVIVNTGLMGRWQILGRNPLVICDTGHNREGLEYVIGQVLKLKNINKMHFVLGFVNDKDLSLVLPLFPAKADYYFTKASVPRALDENVLQHEASFYGLKGKSYNSVREALNAALSHADATDMVFIGGSTFVVAEVL